MFADVSSIDFRGLDVKSWSHMSVVHAALASRLQEPPFVFFLRLQEPPVTLSEFMTNACPEGPISAAAAL